VNGEIINYIGQDAARNQLTPFFKAPHFPNTLISGEAGLGKTELAKWIASRSSNRQVQLHRELPIKRRDLADEYPFVILDECHMQKQVEWLFPYMENRNWTFIGTTNMPEKLAEAFKSRFIVQLRLRPYGVDDLCEMILEKNPSLPLEDAQTLAGAAGGNPRQLERIVQTARALGDWTPSTVLSVVRINGDGITEEHMAYMDGLEEFDRPVGIQYIATRTNIDIPTIKRLERLLAEKQLIELLPNGRTLTARGVSYLRRMRERGLI
jgi:Holliday junction resolvasome RuvABC ATP-dependent DNA helicase subunit